MKIVDAHEDIAWNALRFGRDVMRSAWETRAVEMGGGAPKKNGLCTLGLPEWLAGNVVVVFGTLFVLPEETDSEEAHRQASAQLDYYYRLAERSEQVDVVVNQKELEGVLSSWDGKEHRLGIVPLMEGASPIREPQEAEDWYRRGVRLVGLSWSSGSPYAGGNRAPGPLTDAGRELLEVMAEVGLILDTSHLAEEAFWEAMDRYEGPIVASHANPRAIVPGPRQLSDRMMEALAERGGVIGVVLWNRFLKPDWTPSDGKEAVTLQDVAVTIDHVCQVLGDATHVGLGSDLDGGFGAEETPKGIETVAHLSKIAEALAERGYSDDDVARVMGGNWLRVLEKALPSD